MDELTLILNAAEKRLQFILLQDEILLHAEESEPQKNGTDPLLSHINHACRQLGTHPNRIKKIAATAVPEFHGHTPYRRHCGGVLPRQ